MYLQKALKLLVLATLFAAGGAQAKDDSVVAAKYHYAGITALETNAELVTLHKVFALTNSPKFHAAVITSLSELLPQALALNTSASPDLLHPILDDLSNVESVGSFGGAVQGPIEFVLAVHLAPDHAATWKKNLGQILPGTSEAVTEEGFQGTRWTSPVVGSYRLITAGEWLVLTRGASLLPVENTYLQSLRAEHRPAALLRTNWFEADIDWVRMAPWLSWTNSPLKMARTIVSVTTAGDNFRTTARIIYPEANTASLDAWKFPKATVAEPLLSFTAARGVAPYLNISSAFAPYVRDVLSHQVFEWSLEDVMFQTYALTPMENPTNVMRTVYTNAIAAFNPQLNEKHEGQLTWATNKTEIYWSGLGLVAPNLHPYHEKAGDYLALSLFPLVKGKAVPDDLWQEIGSHADLVYYDWEMTALRLQHWRLLSQILPILPRTSRPLHSAPMLSKTNNPVKPVVRQKPPVLVREDWLTELGTLIGESVTQVTRTSPTEVDFLRKSQTGFTGFELVLFSHWLSGTGIGPFNGQLLPQKAKTSFGGPP